jgi:hypothetical protein
VSPGGRDQSGVGEISQDFTWVARSRGHDTNARHPAIFRTKPGATIRGVDGGQNET